MPFILENYTIKENKYYFGECAVCGCYGNLMEATNEENTEPVMVCSFHNVEIKLPENDATIHP